MLPILVFSFKSATTSLLKLILMLLKCLCRPAVLILYVLRTQLWLWCISTCRGDLSPSRLSLSSAWRVTQTPTPRPPSVIALPMQPRRCSSCVWYSLGGIHSSALKVTDHVRWVPYTTACCSFVTIHLLTSSASGRPKTRLAPVLHQRPSDTPNVRKIYHFSSKSICLI